MFADMTWKTWATACGLIAFGYALLLISCQIAVWAS